jgi:hypothetical protein
MIMILSQEHYLVLAILSEPGSLGVTPQLNEMRKHIRHIDPTTCIKVIAQLANAGHLSTNCTLDIDPNVVYINNNITFDKAHDQYVWAVSGDVPQVQINSSGVAIADAVMRKLGWYGNWTWIESAK